VEDINNFFHAKSRNPMSDAHPSDYSDEEGFDEQEEEENEYGLAATYVGFIATTLAKTMDDIQVLNIETNDCFGYLKKNYYNTKVSLQQYTISTGEDAPRDLLTFCFDEDAYGKRKKLGHNLVMEQFFRNVFIHEGSNPFEHRAFGTFVAYYLHEEEGCPGASFPMPLDISALSLSLQKQASLDWHSQQGHHGAHKISVSYKYDDDDDE